jgi:hypothetical protein
MAIDLKSIGIIAGSVGAVAGLSLLSKYVTSRSASEGSDDESDQEYEQRARRFGYRDAASMAQNDAFTQGEFARSYHGAHLDPMWEGSVKTPEDAIWAQQGAAKEYAIARRLMGLK